MTDTLTCIILAAGKGTRMKSSLHKVLHEVADLPLLGHVLKAAEQCNAAQKIVVVGAGREQVEKAVRGVAGVSTALQAEQNGTGHAVQCARPALNNTDGITLVLYGDVPFTQPETLSAMVDQVKKTSGLSVLGFQAADPGAYGRLILASDGSLAQIVEFKDATDGQRAVTLCNSGILAAPTALLFELLDAVKNDNAAGEYYLTDIVGIARERGVSAGVIEATEAEVQGVNSQSDLAAAAAAYQSARRDEAMAAGVTLQAPQTVFFSHDTVVESDVTIEPNVVFGPGVVVSSGARIRAFSHLEGCSIAAGAVVGPYARLRPGAEIGENVKIGNFVEVKNATFAKGAKANHLSYIGDASVGAAANIGAGTITCNYDGFFKHKTEIGADAFIGSNSALIAPVKVGDGAIVAAGSALSDDVEAGDLALVRAPQSVKVGWATKFKSIMKARKYAAKKN